MEHLGDVVQLSREGLLNEITPDISDMHPKGQIIRMAYCSSRECCRVSTKHSFYSQTAKPTFINERRKNVDPGAVMCPDCNFALRWYTRRSTTTPKRKPESIRRK